jgi:hypothetical protein
MINTRNVVIALLISASALMTHFNSAAAAGNSTPASTGRMPAIECATNERADLRRAPSATASIVGGLGMGTKVLPRARRNGYTLVISRSGRGWAESSKITCRKPE